MNAEILPLAQTADAAHAQLRDTLASIFSQLRQSDPDVADELLKTFSAIEPAMDWLTRPSVLFEGESPLSALSKGRRRDVLAELGRIQHCVY